MVYKFVSVWEIVEKLYRDYDHQEELDSWDIIEWAAEALQFIGAGMQYERRVAEIEITNNIARLPCNFHSQPIVSYNGNPVVLATGGFAPMNITPTASGTNSVNGTAVSQDNFPLSGNTDQNTSGSFKESFYISDGVIVTSFASGTVVMDYKAIKTDCDGYPMIPDLQHYKAAVAAYCQYKLDHIDWRRERLRDKVYMDSKNEWETRVNKARAAANMPNLAYMEAIKNQWVRLKPNQNSASSFYNDLSIREMRKLK